MYHSTILLPCKASKMTQTIMILQSRNDFILHLISVCGTCHIVLIKVGTKGIAVSTNNHKSHDFWRLLGCLSKKMCRPSLAIAGIANIGSVVEDMSIESEGSLIWYQKTSKVLHWLSDQKLTHYHSHVLCSLCKLAILGHHIWFVLEVLLRDDIEGGFANAKIVSSGTASEIPYWKISLAIKQKSHSFNILYCPHSPGPSRKSFVQIVHCVARQEFSYNLGESRSGRTPHVRKPDLKFLNHLWPCLSSQVACHKKTSLCWCKLWSWNGNHLEDSIFWIQQTYKDFPWNLFSKIKIFEFKFLYFLNF